MAKNIINETNSILLKNREILKKNYLEGNTNVSKVELEIQGFDFSYHTSEIKHQNDKGTIKFSYDYGIFELKDKTYKLISLQSLIKTK